MFALGAAAGARREGREHRVLGAWSAGSRGLVCLSVRSGLDLLLEALDFERGDEVAMSAVTHPDMARIVEAHGLRVLPIDLDPVTLSPSLEELERSIGPRTRMLIVAHLFGSSVDLGPVAEVCRRSGLLLVEDCAQSFRGPQEHGDARAAVSLFSFGSIKTATALGGALVRVDDRDVRSRMSEIAERWPVQPRREHAVRAARTAGLLILSRPRAYWLFARLLQVAGHDLDAVVNGSVRGFPGGELQARIRRRPSASLLALLERRLRTFDDRRLKARAVLARRLGTLLPPAVAHPGGELSGHTHWLFPVLTRTPSELVSSLRGAGFDASAKTSGICAITDSTRGGPLAPTVASGLLDQIVFVPAYPELASEIDRLAVAIGLAT